MVYYIKIQGFSIFIHIKIYEKIQKGSFKNIYLTFMEIKLLKNRFFKILNTFLELKKKIKT